MAPSSASIYTSGSSETSPSSLTSDSSSFLATPIRTATIKLPKTSKTPRPRHTLGQASHSPHTRHPKSSTRTGDSPNAPSTATVGGLRAQLHQLIPRHALFHVRIHIHQLSSVPLVKGEFGVRWKFKKVKSWREHGKEKRDGSKGRDDGNVDSDEDEEGYGGDRASVEASGDEVTSSHGHGHVPVPSVIVSSGHRSSSTSGSAPSTRPSTPNPYARYLTSDWLPQSVLSPSPSQTSYPHSPLPESTPSRSLSSATPQSEYAPARGMTPYLKLQDHNVMWEYTLNVIVQMDVNRDTTDLLPNELKLVIMQRVIPGDIDAPRNPRLGAVYLNLAEYADVGSITRRYLLCQSKTNATLKLTIELEHIGGETKYKPPPLPKGEILGGVAGILDNDVYRTRPRTLDLYGMYYDTRDKGTTLKTQDEPFNMSNLSSTYGPRTTETLIEAIFNPVPSHSERESPFTFYVPLEQQGKKRSPVSATTKEERNHHRNGSFHSVATTRSSGHTSVHSNPGSAKPRSMSSQSAHSYSSHGHHSEFGVGAADEGKPRSWWKKIGSRPGTPLIASGVPSDGAHTSHGF